MSGGEGGPIKIGESPYRRSVEKIQIDAADFEICVPRERVISRVPFFKKYQYIHRIEDEDGNLYWDIAIRDGDDWDHITLGKGDPEDEPQT